MGVAPFRNAPATAREEWDQVLAGQAEGALRTDQSCLWTPDNVRRLCCRADRAPGAAPTAFALGFKRLRRARGPRPGQYQPLVVGRGPARSSAEGCGRRRPNAARCCPAPDREAYKRRLGGATSRHEPVAEGASRSALVLSAGPGHQGSSLRRGSAL
jgi:hypothetical protein